ncbi:MAG: helix-turn-helix domain-containing protein [Lentisphaeria bacterium]|nr:helix-turn-helix domain-containing protein [Lentisphaeria bacterium]
MIADRIRQARLASGLSLEQLSKQLVRSGIQITKAGLSNYERGKRQPAPGILRGLSKALGVAPTYFICEPGVTIEWLAFRSTKRLGKKRVEEIKACAHLAADRAMALFDLMPVASLVEFPKRRRVDTLEEADRSAADLRSAWEMGEAPVECLCQTAEDHGAVVVAFQREASTAFDGLSGTINGQRPLLTINTAMPTDRLRFNLAHEIGHVLMNSEDLSEKEGELLAHRFASSLLVPPSVVKQELGERRHALSFEELAILKRKHGMSMAAWMYAARAHGIITQNCYRSLFVEFGRRGWRRQEPVEYDGKEQPNRFRQLTLRALAEDLIGWDKAEELCPEISEARPRDTADVPVMNAALLRTFPGDLRDRVLQEVAEVAAHDYETDSDLTDFEAFGEGDIHEEQE